VFRIFARANEQLRTAVLALPPLRAERDPAATVLHCYSKHVVPHPDDWPANLHTTGFTFLPPAPDWTPPQALADFVVAGEPPICMGLGSMGSADDSGALMRRLAAAAELACVRAVLLADPAPRGTPPLPPNVLCVPHVPHDWLFPRVRLVVHHGGCGATAAALRAGRPSVVIPFAGDQMFWARRLHALGAATAPIPYATLTAEALAAAIGDVLADPAHEQCAQAMAAALAREDGVAEAVACIESAAAR
jgi:sterol 3beta-glucosyltransferase